VIVAAIAKGIQVIWVHEVVCRPQNIKPHYATTHSDSMTFATAIIIAAAMLFEQRSKENLKRFLWLVPLMLVIIVMNNRRLAFVGIGAGVITAFAMMRAGPAKKRITRALLVSSPLLFLYVKVGARFNNPLFMPAQLIDSVVSQSDASSISRDIENFNLMMTLKSSRILGTGFGHEYLEIIRADDISTQEGGHKLYLYIPHNSVLWIWSAVGVVGMCVIWLIYPVTAFFAARGYRHAQRPLERAASLTALGVLMAILAQDWGDMGLHSYIAVLLFSTAYAVAAKLCVVADEQREAVTEPRAAWAGAAEPARG
jgi:hypothetical protein